ncbi:hypothetical protein HUJ05_008741 [Dendroctonus ponderosae]|nr:hypothetical protein HUJ05_008741 [Dendroctonus ponderosae]
MSCNAPPLRSGIGRATSQETRISGVDEDNNNNIIITGSLSQMEAFGALEYCGQIHSSFKSAKCNILLVPDNETVQTPFVPTIHETNVFQDMEYSDTSSESEYSDENVSESPVAHQEGNNSQFEADPAEETFEPRLANRDDNTDNESEADSPDELFKPPATVEEDSNDSEEVGDNEFDASEEDNILKATKGTKRIHLELKFDFLEDKPEPHSLEHVDHLENDG